MLYFTRHHVHSFLVQASRHDAKLWTVNHVPRTSVLQVRHKSGYGSVHRTSIRLLNCGKIEPRNTSLSRKNEGYDLLRCHSLNKAEEVEVTIIRGALDPGQAYEIGQLLSRAHCSDPSVWPVEVDEDADHDVTLFKSKIPMYALKLAASVQMNSLKGNGTTFLASVAHAQVQENDTLHPKLVGVVTATNGKDIVREEELMENFGTTDCWCISNMAVDTSYRRQGIAKKLMWGIEDAIRNTAVEQTILFLFVYRDNDIAFSLYESCGYECDKEWIDPRWRKSAEKGQIGWKRRHVLLKFFEERSPGD